MKIQVQVAGASGAGSGPDGPGQAHGEQADKGLSGFEILPCPPRRKRFPHKMTGAAGGCLLLEGNDMRSGDDDLIHRHLEQSAQRIEVVDTGQALAPLPFVDGLRLLESEIALEIPDRQAALFSEPADICPGSHRIDHGELNHGHLDRLHSSG